MTERTSKLFPLTLLTLTALVSAPALAAPDSQPVNDALNRLEVLYDGMLPWVAELYDPESGGFYESLGLKKKLEPKDYGPDIQSTHNCFSFIRQSDQYAKMPEAFREKLIHYFQSRQDPKTGYFVDPDYPDMWDNQRVLGRALSFCTASLRVLGAKPLYPLPGESAAPAKSQGSSATQSAGSKSSGNGKAGAAQVNAQPSKQIYRVPSTVAESAAAESSTPDNVYRVPSVADLDMSSVPPHLVSAEAMRAWMDERPWEHAWTAVDNIQSQSTLIKTLPEPLQTQIVDEVIRYISERQEADTGYVGGGDDAVRLSGAFKLVLFCRAVKRPIPAADKIQATVIEWLQSGSATDRIFFIRNACDMLNMLIKQTGNELTEEELVSVIEFGVRELSRFHQDDGGFCSFTYGNFVSPNDLYLGKNSIPATAGPQSDVNGTRMAIAARDALYGLAGKKAPKLHMDGFWEACLNTPVY
ncbi:MAG: hypothetical protein ACQKBW_04520 [Puniceicoccales bacterium]